MSLMVCDPQLAESLIQQRRGEGLDRFDEVWDGIYVMSPIADNEHQSLATMLSILLGTVVDFQGLGLTLAGANVSDRAEDWTKNYRVPDVLVFLDNTTAKNLRSHWLGGPDFAIEIVSQGDRSLEKLEFYSSVGVKELLIIDRYPWKLSLYRAGSDSQLALVGTSDREEPRILPSNVVPVAFALDPTNDQIHLYDTSGKIIRSIPTNS